MGPTVHPHPLSARAHTYTAVFPSGKIYHTDAAAYFKKH